MSNESWQTVSQLVIAVGIILTAVGGFGVYHVGQRIEREKERLAAADRARAAVTGVIRPREQVLDSPARIYPALELGDSGAILLYGGAKEQPIFRFLNENSVKIVREEGHVKLSAVIRNASGDIVAELVRNEWKINPGRAWDRNYSSDAVEVRDATGDVVLQVRSLTDRVQFQAKLFDENGRAIGFGTAGPLGGVIEIGSPESPHLNLKIAPMFKYPSETHLGELADQAGA